MTFAVATTMLATPLGEWIAGPHTDHRAVSAWAAFTVLRALDTDGAAVDVVRDSAGYSVAAAIWLPAHAPRLNTAEIAALVDEPAAVRITLVETLLATAPTYGDPYCRLVCLAAPDRAAGSALLRHRHHVLDHANSAAVAFVPKATVDHYAGTGYTAVGTVPLPGGGRLTHLHRAPSPALAGGGP